MVAYEEVYPTAPERLKDFYQHVYRELSFFVDDDLYRSFNSALDVAAICQWEEAQKRGTSQDLAFYRTLIANQGVIAQSKEEIWAGLVHEATCPKQHLV
jgi:hypothetical protein